MGPDWRWTSTAALRHGPSWVSRTLLVLAFAAITLAPGMPSVVVQEGDQESTQEGDQESTQASAQASTRANLTLTIAPPVLLADEAVHYAVYVQLLGADGTPRLASEMVQVFLVSSNPLVARVPEAVTIAAGTSYVSALVTTSRVPGNTTITAVSPGGAPAAAELTTMSAVEATSPLRITLHAAPGTMVPGGQPPGRLSVVLLDTAGRLVPAIDDLEVVLSSSNPTAVEVDDRVTVPKGSHFAVIDLLPLNVGTATLSGLSSGFISESIQVRVEKPGESASTLTLQVSPPFLSSAVGENPVVIIQATDNDGAPVAFPCTQLHLASSAPATAQVPAQAEVSCGSALQYVAAPLTSGDVPGKATITALAPSLPAASTEIEVSGQVPARLQAYLAPAKLLGVETVPGVLVIQVMDGREVPVAAHEGITVSLVGGSSTLPREMVIPKGESFLSIPLSAADLASPADWWFVNPELSSAHLAATAHTLLAKVEVTGPTRPLFPGAEASILTKVTSGGRSLPGALLSWRGTNGDLTSSDPETDANGEGKARFVATNPGEAVVEVTVEKTGYEVVRGEATFPIVTSIERDAGGSGVLRSPVTLVLIVALVLVLGYLGYRRLTG